MLSLRTRSSVEFAEGLMERIRAMGSAAAHRAAMTQKPCAARRV